MLDLFNEVMQSFQLVVKMFFQDLTFYGDITIGWILLAIGCFAVIISYLYGRTRK